MDLAGHQDLADLVDHPDQLEQAVPLDLVVHRVQRVLLVPLEQVDLQDHQE
jgi:hypothetical protein